MFLFSLDLTSWTNYCLFCIVWVSFTNWISEFLHFSKEEKISFVFVLVTQHCITFYIYLSSISPYSKKPTFHIFHLLISPFLYFLLQTHAFQDWPAFGIDNQVVDWNFFKPLTLFMLVNTWHFCLQYGNSCVYFKKLLSHCTWPFTSIITTHNSFKWLNLFQLIAKKKLLFKLLLSSIYSPNLDISSYLLIVMTNHVLNYSELSPSLEFSIFVAFFFLF